MSGHQDAIRALLREVAPTVDRAARQIGVSVATVRGWLQSDGKRRPSGEALAALIRGVDAARAARSEPPLLAADLVAALGDVQ